MKLESDVMKDQITESALSQAGLDLLFEKAHTSYGWQDRAVAPELLTQLVDLSVMGPTAFNQQPMRVIFVQSDEAKARLVPLMAEGNRARVQAAPVTAILCYDPEFWENLPELFPAFDARPFFNTNPAGALESAQRNGTLQAGYMILAARALGLDCGPMSGFDADAVTREFVGDRKWVVNFVLTLGYGDPAATQPRNPRLGLDRIGEVL
jgi:3-hydroxypropanoate dehydrogenase